MSEIETMEKKLRGMRKKMDGIEELEKKKGIKLDDAQKDKLKKKPQLKKDIAQLKDKIVW